MGVMKRIATSNQIGGCGLRIKSEMFFDRAAVIEAVGRANAQALSKAGAFIRRTAKGSIRKVKGPAKPGKPPHSHVGTLKDLIFFSFDSSTVSVVIGPTPFRGVAIAPRALELGGEVGHRVNRRRRKRVVGGTGEIRVDEGSSSRSTRMVKDRFGNHRLVTFTRISTVGQAVRANSYNEELYGPQFLGPAPLAARPYMGPALAKELPKLGALWANSVR
jgi:hypothetical protein